MKREFNWMKDASMASALEAGSWQSYRPSLAWEEGPEDCRCRLTNGDVAFHSSFWKKGIESKASALKRGAPKAPLARASWAA